MSASASLQKLAADINSRYPIIKLQHFSFIRNAALGAGFCYAIEKEKYWHLPFIYIFPSPYVGYQTYKNRDSVIDKIKSILK